jgi:hypothetical protein
LLLVKRSVGGCAIVSWACAIVSWACAIVSWACVIVIWARVRLGLRRRDEDRDTAWRGLGYGELKSGIRRGEVRGTAR